MKHFTKALLIAAALVGPLFASGCVFVPARPYAASAWVPGHWGGPYGTVWVGGHWR
ncbi:hypothetical protein [Dokdonella soli]|uniref:YXWGXW repeat-containing protein n=1 Tax=Dokdonella soli TaxID=529810 RepID=A0ABP3TI75_9GAMM